MDNKYVDFHTHTTRSDGIYTPGQLIRRAVEAGIGVLSITDHNVLFMDNLEMLERQFENRIHLVRGSEISCMYTTSSGKQIEVHVVVLMYDKPPMHLAQIVRENTSSSREGYVNAILDKLRASCGIDAGRYEDYAREAEPGSHIGRMNIAQKLKDMGIVRSVDEAFDIYLGEFGERRAYVHNPICYVSMKRAVEAALADHAVPVLAHLFFYGTLDEQEKEELVRTFKEYAGPYGGLETEYARYDESQRRILREYADRYVLAHSAASDFHGQEESIGLDNHFPYSIYEGLLERKQLLDARL